MKTERLYLELQRAIEESPIIPPCQVTDPEIWYSTEENGKQNRYRKATEMCGQCPAIQACANYAIAADEQFGVWGGLTPQQRSALRNKRLIGRPTVKVA